MRVDQAAVNVLLLYLTLLRAIPWPLPPASSSTCHLCVLHQITGVSAASSDLRTQNIIGHRLIQKYRYRQFKISTKP